MIRPKIEVNGSPDIRTVSGSAFSLQQIQQAQSLTFPRFRGELVSSTDSGSPFRAFVGAFHHESLIGLALAKVISPDRADLLSIYVSNTYRRRGIASELLRHLHRTLSLHGVTEMSTTFTSSLPDFEAIAPLLRNCEWNEPIPRILFCRGWARHVCENATWLDRIKTPEGYIVFPWTELSASERTQVLRDIDAGIAPFELSPFYEESSIDPATSVGLRIGSRVVGWQVNHPLEGEPGVLRFSRNYVYPEYQRTGRALILIKEAILRNGQPEVLEKYPMFLSDVGYERPEMVRFYHRYLIPLSAMHYSSYGSRIQLNGKGTNHPLYVTDSTRHR